MERYEHRQRLARWIEVPLAFMAVFVPFAVSELGAPKPLAILLLAIAGLSWWMLSVLITRVDASGVSWSFAWGWPGGRIPCERIARLERTQLNLLERGSVGLHWTVWHGWLSNVAGAEAVEIYCNDGSRTTLGTDDPQGLCDAIERFRRGAA